MLKLTTIVRLFVPIIAALGQSTKILNKSDVAVFVSRPDLEPLVFDTTLHDPARVSPGYWFIGPYDVLHQVYRHGSGFPAQIGPHIYDSGGELVWSGASYFDKRLALDFKVTSFRGAPSLSWILFPEPRAKEYREGAGIILDSSYQFTAGVQSYNESGFIGVDMHEFSVLNETSALLITRRNQLEDISYRGLAHRYVFVDVGGFQEIDIAAGSVIFEWSSRDHIHPSTSFVDPPPLATSDVTWDWFHLNSVDKTAEGNYLISARYTNSIYKISGIDGSIMWQLGGKNSSFILDGFNFSSQHDARVVKENTTTTIISFLNNASDGTTITANYSSAMLVALYTATSPMTARIVRRWDRPDKALSHLRGNVQILPDSNLFVGWSDNGYISEFTADGDCVLEAKFVSDKFVSYRAYKFNFTADPVEIPTLKAYAGGESPDLISTTYYVSWNGATEVSYWNFHGSENSLQEFSLIGSKTKSGFETVYKSTTYEKWTFAEAVSANGKSLGNSSIQATITPPGFKFSLWPFDESGGSYPNAHKAGNGELNRGLIIGWSETYRDFLRRVEWEYYLIFAVVVVSILAFATRYVQRGTIPYQSVYIR